MTGGENFGNLRTLFFNKSDCSDLVLHICDIGQQEKRVEIHSHLVVLCSASRYIQSCLTSIMNHQNVNRIQTTDTQLVRNKLILRLEIDFSTNELSNEVVQLFFSLFYVQRFDDPHSAETEKIQYHILELYELACHFLYDSLIVYIEQYLIANMNIGYFTPLYRFCLISDPSNGRYQMIESKAPLFTRLLQWYECCVDLTIGTPSVSIGALSYYAEHKTTILEDLYRRVDNIELCQVPSKSISYANTPDRDSISLRYYNRICPSCLENPKKRNIVGAFAYTELGHLTTRGGGDHSETYYFRLKKKVIAIRGSPLRLQNNTIELTRLRNQPQQIQPGGARKRPLSIHDDRPEEKRYECTSKVTLLSKKREKETTENHYSEKDISVPTEIGRFVTHKAKQCYEAHCDQCNIRRHVYIILLDVTLRKERVLPHSSPILEEMEMHVEEPTLCI